MQKVEKVLPPVLGGGGGISEISSFIQSTVCMRYNEFDFFLDIEEYRPFDGCKIEI
jgi:hypothetical protein